MSRCAWPRCSSADQSDQSWSIVLLSCARARVCVCGLDIIVGSTSCLSLHKDTKHEESWRPPPVPRNQNRPEKTCKGSTSLTSSISLQLHDDPVGHDHTERKTFQKRPRTHDRPTEPKTRGASSTGRSDPCVGRSPGRPEPPPGGWTAEHRRGLSVLFRALWQDRWAHALFDGLYPAYVSLSRPGERRAHSGG